MNPRRGYDDIRRQTKRKVYLRKHGSRVAGRQDHARRWSHHPTPSGCPWVATNETTQHIQLSDTWRPMKLKIPADNFGAYLFDCDGTVADSMPLHYIGWQSALAEWNCPFEEDLFYAWGGVPPAEVIAKLNRMHGLQMPVEAVAE